jgi:dTDP-4-dehydrorhamnose reductase
MSRFSGSTNEGLAMRILVLGSSGQVGWELQRALGPLGQVMTLDYPDVDYTRPHELGAIVREARPEVVVNAAAYTDVDGAESEPEVAHRINAAAPGELAEAVRRQRAALIHYSTDYVFDGKKKVPYVESDRPAPISAYGESKLAGERAIEQVGGAYLTLRTSWVYSLRRPSFVTKVLAWSREHTTLRVVTDQVSNPTWARHLAEATALVLARGGEGTVGWIRTHAGLYHLAGSGAASRLDWARAILNHDPHPEEQIAEEVKPAVSADFPMPAARPAFSALNCSRFRQTFRLGLPDWRTSLCLALEEDQSGGA